MHPVVRAYRWEQGALWLLDQRRLPGDEVWVACRHADDVADAIRQMVVRGAPLIGVAAAYGVALAAAAPGATSPSVEEAARRLAAARPTAVNLAWAVGRVMQRLRRDGFSAAAAEDEARRIAEEDEAACFRIGEAGVPLMPERGGVLTHCNTGALATAGIGTAAGVLRRAAAHGRRRKVYATETRPYLQGARLTAWELSRDGLDVTLITDGMAGYVMQQGLVQAVIVGADRIAANGDVANKVGTYSLAVLAEAHGVPFYVAAPLSSIDLSISRGDQIPIEYRAGEEVTHVAGVPVAPAGVAVLHPAFDVTPARLVRAIITDRAILYPPYERSLKEASH
ncbi:MAG: S-methyl-5-thioribose-1-phosphate isomerase [Bacillota bacterium]